MKASFVFRRAIQALLPATLLLAACSKSSTPAPAAPDQARVVLVHDDPNNSTRPIRVTVGTSESASLAYGANSGYQNIVTGSVIFKTTIAATGGATLNMETKTIAKDKSYSYFVYSGANQGSALGLLTEDDLTTPAAGTAKVRLVYVGQNLPSPLGLSKPGSNNTLVAVIPPLGSGSASAFVTIPAGTDSYNLVNASSNTIFPFAGASVLATNFASGRIYTIVLRGTSNATAPTDIEKFTLDLITNN